MSAFIILTLTIVTITIRQTTAEVNISFATYFGDHMVLQQVPKKSSIWGYGDPAWIGQQVDLFLTDSNNNSKIYKTPIKQGPLKSMTVWLVTLDATRAGGPYTITISAQGQTATLTDVCFGDVWLCSGQSNMGFTVDQMFDAVAEKSVANKLPLVRLFAAAQEMSDTPLYDLRGVNQKWSIATADSLGSFSAVCWVYGRYLQQFLGIPIGLISTVWGGTPIEAWASKKALEKCGINNEIHKGALLFKPFKDRETSRYDNLHGPSTHHVLYNAMIHPFHNLTITGVTWYQGESNSHEPDTYNCTFPSMIDDWRDNWYQATSGQTSKRFPFGFVQIGPSNYKYAVGKNMLGNYTDIRWHQTVDYGYAPNKLLMNVFMATATDLTDDDSPYGSVHIRDKLTVGQRLVLAGLSEAYRVQNVKSQDPRVTAYFFDKEFATLKLEFDSRKHQIKVVNPNGFEVCCTDSNSTICDIADITNWFPAPIIDNDMYTVTLSLMECLKARASLVKGLRYMWREVPCEYKKCAVYSMENSLPMAPLVRMGVF